LPRPDHGQRDLATRAKQLDHQRRMSISSLIGQKPDTTRRLERISRRKVASRPSAAARRSSGAARRARQHGAAQRALVLDQVHVGEARWGRLHDGRGS